MWTTFSGNMCNAAAPALVEFGVDNARVLMDGSAGVADDYRFWNTNRWTLLSNSVTYLARLAVQRDLQQ